MPFDPLAPNPIPWTAGYATLADVERLDAALTFTASSKPSTDDVVGFLEDTAAEIDGVLAVRGYQVPVPVSATQSYRLVTLYNARGANAQAQNAAPDSPHADSSAKLWAATLKMLAAGDVELPDAPRDTETAAPRTPRSADTATSFFRRDMVL